jgi:hypothetical protein
LKVEENATGGKKTGRRRRRRRGEKLRGEASDSNAHHRCFP